MAVTGLIGVGFVVVHVLGHLQMFESAARYNAYAHFVHSLGGLLWTAGRRVLAALLSRCETRR
jgi:succinate dehydrogenase / fumarate reductase cytochrome b subunit